jgi:PAS domain S-box-containing protein
MIPAEIATTLLGRAFDGIAISEENRIVYVSDRLAAMTGYAAGEMLGRPPADFAMPGANARRVQVSVQSGREAVYVVQMRHKTGRVIDVEVRSIPYQHGDRSLRLSVFRDVTSQLEAEDKLAELRAQMLFSTKAKVLGEIANGIAHEINNPLSVIRAYTDILRDAIADASVRAYADRIDSTVTRVAQIVRSLAMYTRDSSPEAPVLASVESILRDVATLCETRMRREGVSLERLPVDGVLAVECQPVTVAQVLVNLLYNAADAVEQCASKWVRIGATDRGDEVELFVEDGGPGIPLADQSRIMQAFYTTKPPHRGTGLGLAVSRKIAESHGGDLRLDTEAPCTRFVLRLPKRQPAREPNDAFGLRIGLTSLEPRPRSFPRSSG